MSNHDIPSEATMLACHGNTFCPLVTFDPLIKLLIFLPVRILVSASIQDELQLISINMMPRRHHHRHQQQCHPPPLYRRQLLDNPCGTGSDHVPTSWPRVTTWPCSPIVDVLQQVGGESKMYHACLLDRLWMKG
ncbi:unnamed protein product [Protopolystoma xenopodis]|uniref:Uncharacterized protein n=1 Tax=Protopolystoma xenopodis TaxID=117903 RepID=A0A3S5AU91_9PLAT|nr:unnamed protein product [Protopolystoma xenopodis]